MTGNNEHLDNFRQLLQKVIGDNSFVKIALGNYKGDEKELKNLYIRKVQIKRDQKLAFNYRYQTRDIFKNLDVEDGIALAADFLQNGFQIATLFTVSKEIIFEYDRKGNLKKRERSLAEKLEANQSHDRMKNRLITPAANAYLHALNITDAEGKVYKNAQDKYRQIDHYIQILSGLIKELPAGTLKNVADMGSGKGYLTFALYDYLHQHLKLDTKVTGVEFREDLVELCNRIAVDSGFEQLDFVQGTIAGFETDQLNLLIALHACDTATDDAIYKGIKAGAELIVVAPCCQKQIRKEMEKHKVKNELTFLTRYGIFLEREAEMVTDGIRALILEYFGYRTKVLEFISDAHTPKNVLVVGIKNKLPGSENNAGFSDAEAKREEILHQLKTIKTYFGIGHHYLETLFNL